MKKKISREEFSGLSSEIAEEKHHKDCKYDCCGEHNDFVDFTKCPKCEMTEKIQDQHNDEVWSIIDNVEADFDGKIRGN